MKNTLICVITVLMSASAFAATENPCEGKSAPAPFLHYPANVAAEVVSGKVSATVRKDIRCYKEGTVLTLSDDKDQANYGKVKVEKVKFVGFKAISSEVATRSGMANVAEVQKGLISSYGKSIEAQPLTEIYFSVVK
jgi:hypothetical protein